MAKKVAKDDKPFRPVHASLSSDLVASVAGGKAQRADPDPVGEGGGEQSVAPGGASEDAATVVPMPRRQRAASKAAPPPAPGPAAAAPFQAPISQQPPRRSPNAGVEKLEVEKRLLLTKSEELELERMVMNMAAAIGTKVKLSHVLRAALNCMRHAEDDVLHAMGQSAGALVRPPNGDLVALAEFEHQLARIMNTAFRKAPPMH